MAVCATTREMGSNTNVRKYLFSHITVFQTSLSVRYTNTIEVTKSVLKVGEEISYRCATEPTARTAEMSLLATTPGRRGVLLEIGQGIK
jgi:hypothetical protein